MVGKLTGGPSVGIGELATEDNLICLRPIEVVAGLSELAEEVAEVLLGACVQDLEVGRWLHSGVPARRSKCSETDQRYSTDGEGDNDLPQTGAERRRSVGGALANALVVGHMSWRRRGG